LSSDFFMPRKRKTLQERFGSRYLIDDKGCWIWQGATGGGYGQIRDFINGRHVIVGAHRVSYMIHRGPIPPGLEIDHLCRNKTCVNPDHLELVTSGENTRRYSALITHCPHGHAYEGENVVLDKYGHRSCRACLRLRSTRLKPKT
jgi:hypothetical protein